MGFSIGKLFGNVVQDVEKAADNVVHDVESAVDKGMNTVKNAVSSAETTVKGWVDTFEHGVVDPLRNFGSRNSTGFEPSVTSDQQGKAQYGNLGGNLMVDGVSPNDVHQGDAGDCYYLASLAAVAQTHPELIQNAIRDNGDGTYTVKFHEPPGMDWMRSLGMAGINTEGYATRLLEHLGLKPTNTSEVTMDGQLPLKNGNDPYVHNGQNEEWPMLMEKAFAKWWGGYTAIGSGGDGGVGLMSITGAPIDRIGMGGSQDQLWNSLSSADAAKQPMVASRIFKGEHNGLIDNHVYTVMGTSTENGQRYVELRNPWGDTEPGNDGNNDGIFKMPLADFAKEFSYVDVARTPPVAPSPSPNRS